MNGQRIALADLRGAFLDERPQDDEDAVIPAGSLFALVDAVEACIRLNRATMADHPTEELEEAAVRALNRFHLPDPPARHEISDQEALLNANQHDIQRELK